MHSVVLEDGDKYAKDACAAWRVLLHAFGPAAGVERRAWYFRPRPACRGGAAEGEGRRRIFGPGSIRAWVGPVGAGRGKGRHRPALSKVRTPGPAFG